MMEFFLSDFGIVMYQLIVAIIAAFILIAAYIYHKFIKLGESNAEIIGYALALFIAMICGIPLLYISKTSVSDENWKQIYTNDNDTKVIITNSSQYGLLVNNDLIAGDKLSADYKLFTVPSEADIKIKKDDASYSKKVRIKKDNIVINGDLNKDSRITKIEYKNIQGHQRSLFGQKGPIEKDEVDGELRITIEQDSKQKELKQIFENKD